MLLNDSQPGVILPLRGHVENSMAFSQKLKCLETFLFDYCNWRGRYYWHLLQLNILFPTVQPTTKDSLDQNVSGADLCFNDQIMYQWPNLFLRCKSFC